ncbi:hypothetical protein TUMEXPCC7403_15070 [Tumidithrix helvetica PCC 7403]
MKTSLKQQICCFSILVNQCLEMQLSDNFPVKLSIEKDRFLNEIQARDPFTNA